MRCYLTYEGAKELGACEGALELWKKKGWGPIEASDIFVLFTDFCPACWLFTVVRDKAPGGFMKKDQFELFDLSTSGCCTCPNHMGQLGDRYDRELMVDTLRLLIKALAKRRKSKT
jgi:hypothetical protein